ncbi:MAG: hypothetical protein KKA73_00895 [Chloroflexi bacterium]|nr:hypothetical protein [Chloroflexota bacterium]MBU1746220.1 hypothetical protein [Chloroflexota bacterium]
MTDLDAARRDELLEDLARRVHGWGLVTPAILFLVAHKPLSFVGSQFLLLAQPLLGLVLPDPLIGEAALLLEQEENVDRLIERLETLAADPKEVHGEQR